MTSGAWRFQWGYYRTATFDVHLFDPGGRPLIWGDPIPGRATVQVLIESAVRGSVALHRRDDGGGRDVGQAA